MSRGIILSTIFALTLLLGSGEVVGQKKSKKRKKRSKSTAVSLSSKDSLEAVSYFFDGQKAFLLDNQEDAFIYFNKSLQINPDNGAANFKIGQILYEKGKLDEALVYAKRAVAINDSNEYYYQLEGSLYTGLLDYESAANTYETLLKKIGSKGEYLFELAALYLYSEKYDEALGAYERAKIFYGPNDQITKQKQSIYLKQDRLEDAVREGEELIEAFPDNPDYELGLVEILISHDNQEQGEKRLFDVKKKYPDNSKVDIMLSEILRKKGQYGRSIEILKGPFLDPSLNFQAKLNLFQGYLELLPNDSLEMPLANLARTLVIAHPTEVDSYAINGDINLGIERKDSALYYYKKSLEIRSGDFKVWQNIVQLESEFRQYDSVIVHANLALESYPNQALFYYYLGTGYYVKEDYQKAIDAFQSGRKFARKDPNLYSVFSGQLGDAYQQLEKYDESFQSYEDALKLNPDNDHVLNNYSYYLSIKNKEMDKALEMSTLLVKNFPENATYLDTHGWVLYVMGNYKEALKYLEEAVANSENGTIIEHYGDALFRLDRVEEAVEQWKKAKKIDDGLTEFIDKKIADKKLYE